jgi:adenine-specific DNA-methyltransferase
MPKINYENYSKDELLKEIKKLQKRKKYGIVWEDKPEQVALLCKEKLPFLAEDKSKEIVTDKEKPINILIEGDNYHALSVLSYTHKGRIDVIYIDPPYNTGNGDSFRYNDKIVDKEDAYRHSKWLSFMEKRLKLARNLLKNNGIVFISIDENEVAQLKLLCDEIFGEKNLVAIHVWRKVVGGKSQGKISTQHEYIITYAKNEPSLIIANLSLTESLLKKYKYEDKRGKYDLREIAQGKGLSYSESLYYEIEAPDGSVIPKPPKDKGYRWSKEKWLWGLKQDPPFCVMKKVKGRWVPFVKQYLDYDNEGNKIERGVWPHTWLDDHGFTRTGTKNLDDLIGEGKFEHPKPVKLIKYLVKLHPNNSAVVLDFFVGSGTTAQAILELNNEEKGNRKFIVCTNNENNICTEVCYPRVKKVIQNLEKEAKGKLIENTPGNLKYFRADFVDAEPTDKNKKKMVDKSTEMLCLKEDCFDEVIKGNNFKIFENKQGKFLGIVYDDDGIEPFKKEVKKIKKKFVVYVFSLDESAREENFEDMKDLVDLKPIPAVILNVYKRIFK